MLQRPVKTEDSLVDRVACLLNAIPVAANNK
jgi:hypothetical protein